MPATRVAFDAAIAAAHRAGLPVSGAAVMRVGTSVLVHLPRAAAVARVEPVAHAESVARQVAFARAAAAAGAPVVRLQIPEVIDVSGHLVTLWEALAPVGEVTGADLGRAARGLHDATLGGAPGVPEADPLGAARRLLAVPHPFLSPADQAGLVALVDALARRWVAELAAAPRALVHGDLHRGNAVVTARGPVLVDLEYAGVGPVGLDGAAVGAHVKRYGLDPQWIQGFADGYGRAMQADAGHDLLCDVYALHVALWALQVAHTSAEVAAEAALRVDCLLGRSTAQWTLR